MTSGKLSQDALRPRLSSRERYGISSRKKQEILNGEDANSKLNLGVNNKPKVQQKEQFTSVKKDKGKKSKKGLDSSRLGTTISGKEGNILQKTTTRAQSPSKKKVFRR